MGKKLLTYNPKIIDSLPQWEKIEQGRFAVRSTKIHKKLLFSIVWTVSNMFETKILGKIPN